MNKTETGSKRVKGDGFFQIAFFNPRVPQNIGSLCRSMFCFGGNGFHLIAGQFTKTKTDTVQSWKNFPVYQHVNFDQFFNVLPYATKLVGIELTEDSTILSDYKHPQRAIYLLGSEGGGLPDKIIERCHDIIQIPSLHCLNVAVTGGIVMHDRISKYGKI